MLALKVAGAAAGRGYSLAEVARAVREACAGMGTMGVCLAPCTLPGRRRPPIPEDEMEVGLGIHGEAGLERCPLKSSRQIAQLILDKLTHGLRVTSAGQRVSVLVNNLGGASALVRIHHHHHGHRLTSW